MATTSSLIKTVPAKTLVPINNASANVVLSPPIRALLVGGAGTVSVIALDDDTPVTLTVATGQLLPIEIKQVNTGGTATGLVGLR